jgi:hypothetical protein
MWMREIPASELFSANRWIVSFFEKDGEEAIVSAFPMRRLSEIANERGAASDPQKIGDVIVNYLGLEHVRSLTGELVDFVPRRASSVKSRSKIFQCNDVLYGRLRPELNKVFLAQGEVTEGLCSSEFIVLVPNINLVLPRYLRHVLASSFVTRYAGKLKVGASLPRMAAADLLSIELPVPPIEVQNRMVARLAKTDEEIAHLRRRLESLPSEAADAFLSAIASGGYDL